MTRSTKYWIPLATGLLVAGLILVLSLRRRYQWIGDSRSTISAVIDAATLASLVVLVLTAFAGAVPARRRQLLLEATTSRGAAARLIQVSGRLGLAGIVGLLAATAVMTVQTGSLEPASTTPWLSTLPSLCLMPLAAVAGYVIGSMLKWPPLALALAPVGWAVVGYATTIPVLQPLFAFDTGANSYEALSGWFTGLQSLLYLSAATAIFLALTGARGLFVAVIIAAVAAGGVVSRPMTSWYHPDPAALRVSCSDGELRLCLTAAEEPTRAELTDWLSDARDAATVAPDPVAFASEQVPDDALPAGTSIIRFTPPANFVSTPKQPELLANVLPHLMNPGDCPTSRFTDADGKIPVTTMGQVLRWRFQSLNLPTQFTGLPIGPGYADAPDDLTHRLNAMSPTDRQAWFDLHRRDLLACKQVA